MRAHERRAMDHAMNAVKLFSVALADWNTFGVAMARLRTEVFVREQNVPPELEADGLDADTTRTVHAVARDDAGEVIGTGRLVLDQPLPRIGRMAVLKTHRRSGVGGALLEALCDEAARRGYARVMLHAQSHASGFYYHHGFLSHGQEFFEAGIPHQEMHRNLTPGA